MGNLDVIIILISRYGHKSVLARPLFLPHPHKRVALSFWMGKKVKKIITFIIFYLT